MKEILKLTLSLTLICAIAGAALAFVSYKTAEPVRKAQEAQRAEKMLMLLPEGTMTVDPAIDHEFNDDDRLMSVTFYVAKNAAGEMIAYCAEAVDHSGFGGDVKVLVGLNPDGTVRGVLVSEHSETPGIGSKVCERSVAKSFWSLFKKSQEAALMPSQALLPNDYLDAFTGKPLPEDGFNLTKTPASHSLRDIKPVSGATVTSTAVINAVNRVCSAWHHFTLEFEKK